MDGITVIAEHFCREIEAGELVMSLIVITLLIGSAQVLYWHMHRNSQYKLIKKLTIICSVIISVVYVWFCHFQANRYNTTHMEYTITVDDSVSFNDFNKKYEIISVDGTEYRVKEK